MTDVQRSGGVCRHEFEQDLRMLFPWLASVLASLQHGLEFRMKGRRAQVEIDESGTRDVDPVDLRDVSYRIDNACRELTRTLACTGFASCIAILLAKSPWLASRVRSRLSSGCGSVSSGIFPSAVRRTFRAQRCVS